MTTGTRYENWVDNLGHDFEEGPYNGECEKEIAGASSTTSHYSEDDPATCTRKVFDATGVAGDQTLADTRTVFYSRYLYVYGDRHRGVAWGWQRPGANGETVWNRYILISTLVSRRS